MLPRSLAPHEVVEFAQRAERAGFDELWVVEDCFFRGGIAQAATVLASTSSIVVGVGILPAAVRNAAFTALECATLAELFPGRIHVGIGHGMPAWMRQVGAWPQSPLTLLAEHLEAVRALVRGARLTSSGRYVHLDDVALATPPAVAPLVLAGVRGPRSLEVSGRLADGTILAEPVTPEYLRVALGHIEAGRSTASGSEGGTAPAGSHRVVAYAVAAVHDSAAEARAAVRPALAWIGDPDWEPHIAPLDFADDFRAARASATSREAFAEALQDDWVDRLTVSGPPDAARARIDALHDAGASSVVLIPVGADGLLEVDRLARVLR